MNSITMWGLRDLDGEMHFVETMAHAYVMQKKNPGWEAFILRIPESGFYEVERGPIQIIQRRRLYGDPTRPILSIIGRVILSINGGWAIGELAGSGKIIWLIPIILSVLGIMSLVESENNRLLIALARGKKFFSEVCRLAGDDVACSAVNEWWTKGESYDDGKHYQDAGQSEGNREDRQRDAH